MEPMNMGDYKPPADSRRAQGMPWWPAVAVIVLLAVVVVWFLWSRSREATVEELAVSEPAVSETFEEPAPEPVEEVSWELPSLAESDDFLRDIAGRLSSHPEWVSWIATDDLVSRFVAGVDEVARGEIPTAQARFLVPKRGFEATSGSDGLLLDAKSHKRYDRAAAVVAGLDADGVAQLYSRLRPLFQKAYRDLGYPEANFDDAFEKAIEKILATPPADKEPELVAALQSYKFADPELEALPPVQKLVLRMGPINGTMVKSKLREIAQAIDQQQVAGSGS